MDVAKSIGHYARELGLAQPQHGGSRRKEVAEAFQRLDPQSQARRATPPVEATVEGEWLGRSGAETHSSGPSFANFSQGQGGQSGSGGYSNTANAVSAYRETSTLTPSDSHARLVDYYA